MATLELAAPPPADHESSQAGGPDAVVIHPFLHLHPLKSAVKGSSPKKALQKYIAKGSAERQGRAFLDSLDSDRAAFCTALESPSVGDQAVEDAVNSYVSLLLGLVTAHPAGSSTDSNGPSGSATAAAAGAASPDEALSAAESGSAGSGLSAAASRLRHAGQYEWAESVLGIPPGAPPRKSASSDAMFELAQALVAAALRLMHASAEACLDSPTGVATPASTRAYKLLRQAAGVLEFVGREVLPWLPRGLSADCEPQIVKALATLALADAQQLTVLRAVAKGNQPALISAIAADTAALYSQACAQLASSSAAGAGSSKLWHYGQYKAAYLGAYAHCFNGILLWKQRDNCGGGLRSLQEAAQQFAAAKKVAASYDASPPATLNLAHRRVDENLERVIADTQRRMQRENDTVFLQPLAADLPVLPEKKRLVSSTPYALPQPAAAVREGVVEQCFAAGPVPAEPTQAPAAVTMHTEGGSGSGGKPSAAGAGAAGAGTAAAAAPPGSGAAAGAHAAPAGDSGEQGCSCCRWAAFIIAVPVLAVLWLLGAVIWVLLLPLKCCCPCIGLPIQWAVDLMLWLMKAPARGLLWASGKSEPHDEGAAKASK